MKAIVFAEYGSADLLQLAELAKPTPNDDEVLVRVHASSINSWDWEFLSGSLPNRLMLGLLKPRNRPQILGADIAGIVEAVGKDIQHFKPGDKVFGDLWDRFGGFAEYTCAPQMHLRPMPTNLDFWQAAAVPQAGVLALQGLQKTGQLKSGQKVLINGAGGGVGTFAVQIARLAGAEVTGVDNGHKLQTITALGADHVIDYTREDFTENGQRYDLILDTQGIRSMFDYKHALSPNGIYAMVGGTNLRVLQAVLLGWWLEKTGGSNRFRLVYEGPNTGLSELKTLIEAGRIMPVIDRTYDLTEVPEAFRYFRQGCHNGKLVVRINHR